MPQDGNGTASTSTALVSLDHNQIKTAIRALESPAELKETMLALVDENRGLRKRDVKVLGKDEIFVRTGDGGEMTMARFPLKLSFQKGELYTIKGHFQGWSDKLKKFVWTHKANGTGDIYDPLQDLDFHLAATGYWSIAKHSGIHVGDVTIPDPDQDPESGIITAVKLDLMAMGFDPIGNLRISRLRFNYRAMDEFLESLKGKEKYCTGIEMVSEREFLDAKTHRPPAGKVFQRLVRMGKDWIGFSCDLKNGEVREILGNVATLNKNAERKARTVGERLVLKSWTGLRQASPIFEDPKTGDIYTVIPITAWQKRVTRTHFEQVAQDLRDGQERSELDFDDGNTVTGEVTEIEADEAEVAQTADAEAGLDDTFQTQEDDEEDPESAPSGTPAPKPTEAEMVEGTRAAAIPDHHIRQAVAAFDLTYGDGEAAQHLADELGLDLEALLHQGVGKGTAAKIVKELSDEREKRNG